MNQCPFLEAQDVDLDSDGVCYARLIAQPVLALGEARSPSTPVKHSGRHLCLGLGIFGWFRSKLRSV